MAAGAIMSPAQAAVWKFLRMQNAGVGNAQPRAAILNSFNACHPSVKLNDRHFRLVIEELVKYFKKPICSTPTDGYFVAVTEAEKQHAIAHLKAIGASAFERARSLEESGDVEAQGKLL